MGELQRFKTAVLAALLLALPCVFAGASPSIRQPASLCEMELVQAMRGVVKAGEFQQFRGLSEYAELFGPRFVADLARLTRLHTWIDMGAGHARALKEYLLQKVPLAKKFLSGKANLVAVTASAPKPTIYSIMLDKMVGHAAERIRAMNGHFVEDIPNEELGRADLITDIYGPAAYSDRLDAVLDKYLGALNEGGVIYLYDSPAFPTAIKTASGTKTFAEWLEGVPGLRVQHGGDGHGLRITRTVNGPVQVPKLKLTYADPKGAPPKREFEEVP